MEVIGVAKDLINIMKQRPLPDERVSWLRDQGLVKVLTKEDKVRLEGHELDFHGLDLTIRNIERDIRKETLKIAQNLDHHDMRITEALTSFFGHLPGNEAWEGRFHALLEGSGITPSLGARPSDYLSLPSAWSDRNPYKIPSGDTLSFMISYYPAVFAGMKYLNEASAESARKVGAGLAFRYDDPLVNAKNRYGRSKKKMFVSFSRLNRECCSLRDASWHVDRYKKGIERLLGFLAQKNDQYMQAGREYIIEKALLNHYGNEWKSPYKAHGKGKYALMRPSAQGQGFLLATIAGMEDIGDMDFIAYRNAVRSVRGQVSTKNSFILGN